MPERRPRILCYSPYTMWALHGQWEMTILHGLKLRGADVRYVLCDGLYTDCDVFWQATSPRPANACELCRARVSALAGGMGMEHEWLGGFVTLEERRAAREWSLSVPREELRGAVHGDWDVAEWITSSVHSHLRRSALDLAEPEVEEAFRSYLGSGLVACVGLSRLLDDAEPDAVFVFNGRQSSTRVMLELARRRGIRVVTHERGSQSECLKLVENGSCVSLDQYRSLWEEWGGVPLSAPELAETARILHEREHGTGLNWKAFSPPPQPLEATRNALRLDPDRPVWALFTSSDDELVADSAWRGQYARQLDWIEETVGYARRHPELDLVIRVHPNTGGRRATGSNVVQLRELEELARRLPPNGRIVMPEDEISTYSLMELASVGLVFQSTVALELACKGKPTVVVAGNVVAGLPFVRTVGPEAPYEQLLDDLRTGGPADDGAVRRDAFRFAYGYFHRLDLAFPLVRMPTPHEGQLAYRTLEELAPGCDEGLDRACRILLENEPVLPPPGPAERARDDADERAFFARRFTALAFAEELIARPGLLVAWGEAFAAADPATLVIHTPAGLLEDLVAAVAAAGLDGEEAADLVAVDEAPAGADAVYSRRVPSNGRPSFDDGSVADLRRLAESLW